MNGTQEETTKKIRKEIGQAEKVLDFMDYLNFSKSDIATVSIISEFSQRNKRLLSGLMTEYKTNISKLERKDSLHFQLPEPNVLGYFVIRDIIENLEIIFYILLEKDKWVDNFEFTEKYFEVIDILNGKKKKKELKINKIGTTDNVSVLEKAINKKYKEEILTTEFSKIREIKNECNNYIHKNGLKYINIKSVNYFENFERLILKLLFLLKFNFKLMFLLNGSIISSSDYMDYADMGMNPPEGSQYLVATIFAEYIEEQFSKEEKQWLLKHNYYGMKI